MDVLFLIPNTQSEGKILRGGSFLSPGTRSECFLRGVKFLAENLRGMEISWEIIRGMKFSHTRRNKGYEIFEGT